MIKLKIEDYCEGCTEFEAVTESPQNAYDSYGNIIWLDDTIVHCKHRMFCKRLIKHLEEKRNANS